MTKLAILGSRSEKAKAAVEALRAQYGHVEPDAADVIVALGGDGFMLHCLHEYIGLSKPLFGMNRGTLGFLMNEYRLDRLYERLSAARQVVLYPLRADVTKTDATSEEIIAFNEVALTRDTAQSANIEITIDGVSRIKKYVGDGILVATSQGSTAYNRSVHGPVLPIGLHALALAPISGFMPRSWRGAVLPNTAVVKLTNLDPDKRPLFLAADSLGIRDVQSVTIRDEPNRGFQVLFDPDHSMEERILREQFPSD